MPNRLTDDQIHAALKVAREELSHYCSVAYRFKCERWVRDLEEMLKQ